MEIAVRLPAQGVIPGLIRVTVDPASSPQRRNVFTRLLRAVRGDKYMVDAYPGARSPEPCATDIGQTSYPIPGSPLRSHAKFVI